MNFDMEHWYVSWWFIIIVFLIFWPVGIALCVVRYKVLNDRTMLLGTENKKIYVIAGIAFLVLSLVNFLMDRYINFILFLAAGIALLVLADKLKRRAGRNHKYVDLILNQGETRLDRISSVCNVKYEPMIKELKGLIKVGVLRGAVLDEAQHCITIPSLKANPVEDNSAMIQMNAGQNMVVCTCPGCGASLSVRKGMTISCEYCDAPVRG